jgi:hypothetical protein
MKTLPSVNGVEFSNYILLLSFVIRHSSLEAVFPDACIRPFQGMSIFPEVSQSMNEHKVSHASLAHTSLVSRVHGKVDHSSTPHKQLLPGGDAELQ